MSTGRASVVGISGSPAHIFAERSGLLVPDKEALEVLLIQCHADARKAWPRVSLPVEAFVAHVAERVPQDRPGVPVAKLLGMMALSDLYLACACATGVREAEEVLESAY